MQNVGKFFINQQVAATVVSNPHMCSFKHHVTKKKIRWSRKHPNIFNLQFHGIGHGTAILLGTTIFLELMEGIKAFHLAIRSQEF